jgi:hypothetical protein
MTQQGRYWHNIVTIDESWFYFNIDNELIWLPADEKVPERQFDQKIDVDNSLEDNRFPLDQCSSKRDQIQHQSFRYITDILVLLLEWRKTQVGGGDRKLIVYTDHAANRRRE